ncbi:unnamed protein product [Citrullus colocynthis]|uniref:Uncharacterized protein n=1 Tax=Citrullus colocynthis TaxID=252529 RepID=A0ABP0Z594_9ROSI
MRTLVGCIFYFTYFALILLRIRLSEEKRERKIRKISQTKPNPISSSSNPPLFSPSSNPKSIFFVFFLFAQFQFDPQTDRPPQLYVL